MKIQTAIKSLGLLLLSVVLGCNNPIFAQSEDENNETAKRYEELLEYRTNFTLQKDEEAEKLSETYTGIQFETPDNVYLADLALTAPAEELKEVTLNEQPLPSEEENLSYDTDIYGYVGYGDLFGAEEPETGGGSGVSTDRCVPNRGAWFNY